MPAIVWRHLILAGDVRNACVDVSAGPIGDALRICYPTMGLASLAQLSVELPQECGNIVTAYGLHWNDRLAQILAMLAQTPDRFQAWVEDKSVSARELQPLLALPALADFAPVLEHLAASTLTRSQGAQGLEWAVDLYLSGHPIPLLLAGERDWFQRLRDRRRPQAAQDREARESFLRGSPWPSHTTARWCDESDLPLLEIRLQSHSPADLKGKLQRLADVADTWMRDEVLGR